MVSKRIIDSGLSLDWISLQIVGHQVRNTDLRVALQRVTNRIRFFKYGLLDFGVQGLRFTVQRVHGSILSEVEGQRFGLVFLWIFGFATSGLLENQALTGTDCRVAIIQVFLGSLCYSSDIRVQGSDKLGSLQGLLVRFRIRFRFHLHWIVITM